MKQIIFVFLFLISIDIFAQDTNLTIKSYAQFTFAYEKNSCYFSLHRLKFWAENKFNKNFSVKFQSQISGFKEKKFLLQDIYFDYNRGKFDLRLGQFVPQFSLQRFQPDYKLNIYDRAASINFLIPDGTIGIRDLGLQLGFYANFFKAYLGLFNGFGLSYFNVGKCHYLLTNKYDFNFNSVNFGFSFMFRKNNLLSFPQLLNDTLIFNKDFRLNFFIKVSLERLNFQSEYTSAFIGKYRLYGYYFLTDYYFGSTAFSCIYDYYFSDFNKIKRLGIFINLKQKNYNSFLFGGYYSFQEKSPLIYAQIQFFLLT